MRALWKALEGRRLSSVDHSGFNWSEHFEYAGVESVKRRFEFRLQSPQTFAYVLPFVSASRGWNAFEGVAKGGAFKREVYLKWEEVQLARELAQDRGDVARDMGWYPESAAQAYTETVKLVSVQRSPQTSEASQRVKEAKLLRKFSNSTVHILKERMLKF